MWGIIGGIAGAVIVAIGAGLAAAVSLGGLTGAGIAWTLARMAAGGLAGMAAGSALASSGEQIGAGVITPTGKVIKTDPMDYMMGITKQEAQQSSALGTAAGQSKVVSLTKDQGDEIITLLRKMPTAYLAESLSGQQVSATKKVGQQK